MLDAEAEKQMRPHHGGSKAGRNKSKPHTGWMKQHMPTIFGTGIT
jgi:hypothetical protein